MRGFIKKMWVQMLWFSLFVHLCYFFMVIVGAGTLITKKSVEVVLTALNLEGAANILTASVYTKALERTEGARVRDSELLNKFNRSLAAEEANVVYPLSEAVIKFKGRGLLSEEDVIDISAIEAEIEEMNFGVLPEAVELKEAIPRQFDNEIQAPRRIDK